MMQNKKGFTLIELLAVIVILAVIALITTPTILNVMENARKDSAKDKAYGVIQAVQLAYTQAQVEEEVNLPYTVTFATDSTGKVTGSVGTKAVKASGEMPTSGEVMIDDKGQIYINATGKSGPALKFGNYYCYDLGEAKNHEVECTR